MTTYRILNLGAGVQSTTLYLMSLRQDEPEVIPRFDYAIFADTGEEPQAVYDHLDWLKSLSGPPILTVSAGIKLGDALRNGVNATGQRFVSIPAYTKAEGDEREGITRRQCTKEFKTDILERAIRRDILRLTAGQRVPADVQVERYLGLSFDEPRRIISVKRRFQGISWAAARFPLFDLEMSRRACLAYLEGKTPHPVPRSACVFCPFHSNAEWRAIRDHDPAGWARATEIDEAIRDHDSTCTRGLNKQLFLHRSSVPLSVAPIDTPESRGEQYLFSFAQECEGMCGV